MKVEIIGSHLCQDTTESLVLLKKEKGVELEFFNISEDLKALKKFLYYRESEEMYTKIKENGGIGIPFFILEDGTKTFAVNEILKRIKK